MNSCTVLNAFFLSNPLYRGIAEKIILVGTGICGLVFSWKRFPAEYTRYKQQVRWRMIPRVF
jgi:hypothetical protein